MKKRPLAVSLMPLEARYEVIRHVAFKAEALGYDAFFMPETWSYDMTVLLAEIAVKTSQLKIGTSILSMWGRTPATIAMAAASLNQISNGRFILGLGASSPPLTEGFHDLAFEKPFTKLRQTLIQVRALLEGRRIPLTTTPEARALKLNVPPQPDIPLCLGASSPKSIRMAGELADGWLPFLTPRDSLADSIDILQEGALASSTPDKPRFAYPMIGAMVDEDEGKARDAMAWFVAFYCTMMGPIYPKALGRSGYKAEVAAVQAANKGRKPALVPIEATALIEQLTMYGTPDTMQAKLKLWYDAGATMPVLLLNPGLEIEQYDMILESFIQ